MRARARASLFLLASLSLPVSGAETIETSVESVRFSGTDHLLFSSAEDLLSAGKAKNSLLHESDLRLEYGPYTGAIQFTNRLGFGEYTGESRPFVLEKKLFSGEWERWEVKLGDSHQELGRGIALSLYRDDVFGVNHTLEGGSFKFRPEGWELHLFGGRVNTLESPVALNPQPDPLGDNQLWLIGGGIQHEPTPLSKVGAHYFIALNRPPEEKIRLFDKVWNTAGLTYLNEDVLPDVELYLESNLLHRQLLVREDYEAQPLGAGSYASVVWAPLPWKVRWEAKDYRNYYFDLRRAPTLEEDIVETQHAEDVSATRLYVENKDVERGKTYFGSYLYGRDRFVQADIHHGVLGLKLPAPWTGELEMRAGYRELPGNTQMAHGSVKFKVPTAKHQSIELGLSKQYSRLGLNLAPRTEDRNRADLTYTFAPGLFASVNYEFMPSNTPAAGQHFVALSGSAKLDSLIAKGLIGRTSGGTVCSGGVCRVVPPFTGAMLETQVTF